MARPEVVLTFLLVVATSIASVSARTHTNTMSAGAVTQQPPQGTPPQPHTKTKSLAASATSVPPVPVPVAPTTTKSLAGETPAPRTETPQSGDTPAPTAPQVGPTKTNTLAPLAPEITKTLQSGNMSAPTPDPQSASTKTKSVDHSAASTTPAPQPSSGRTLTRSIGQSVPTSEPQPTETSPPANPTGHTKTETPGHSSIESTPSEPSSGDTAAPSQQPWVPTLSKSLPHSSHGDTTPAPDTSSSSASFAPTQQPWLPTLSRTKSMGHGSDVQTPLPPTPPPMTTSTNAPQGGSNTNMKTKTLSLPRPSTAAPFPSAANTTGTCKINTTATSVTGGITQLSIETTGWSGSALKFYQFSYSTQMVVLGAGPVTATATSIFTFTAPIPQTDAETIQFKVKALDVNQDVISTLATTTCSIVINRPSDLSQVRTTQLSILDASSSAGTKDSAAVLQAAQLVVDATDSTTATTDRAAVNQKVLQALTDTFTAGVTTTPSVDTSFTKDQRHSVVQILAAVVAPTSIPAVNVTSDEQKQVDTLVLSILKTEAKNLETAGQGTVILSIIDTIVDKAVIQTSTRSLGQACGSNLLVGTAQTVDSAKYKISAHKKLAKDMRGATVTSGNGTVEVVIPAGLVNGIPSVTDSTEVSLSSVQYAGGNPTDDSAYELQGPATEIDIFANGVAAQVSNLADPVAITLEMTTSGEAGQVAQCRYFDRTANAWSSFGLTTGACDTTSKKCVCYSTHMSMFAPTLAASSATSSPATSVDDSESYGVYIAIAVGAVLIICVIALVLITKKPKRDSHTFDDRQNDDTAMMSGGQGGGALNVPLASSGGGELYQQQPGGHSARYRPNPLNV